MPLALLYHDVIAAGREDESGFPGPGAARYKLAPEEFRAHLDAIARVVGAPPAAGAEPLSGGLAPWLLTFDDGGKSACSPIADLLEEKGWRGHFFLTTDCIGRAGFVNREEVRDLRRRGHVLGSHSCSHPERISACATGQLLEEWQRSREVLSDILGEAVTTGSVPGGFYSRRVAEAAAQAGLRVLFTSEPTTSVREVGGCLVVGRYSVYRGMSAGQAAALVAGKVLPRLGQALSWNLRKLAKAAGGRLYLRLREGLLRRAYGGA